jgi:diguanylate cyclase (GGDEF)-like protein
VIFLQARDRDQGFAIAERMRRDIAGYSLDAGGKRVTVTVSIGGSLKSRCTEIIRAIEDADAALYRAKAAGRNTTVFAPPREQSLV